MKTIFSFCSVAILLAVCSNLNAQSTPSKTSVPSAQATNTQVTPDLAKVVPVGKKGEVTRETDCIDLFVKKGCVKYSVFVPNDSKKPDMVQVCAQGNNTTDVKKVDICRPGATKITVKYEKTEDGAIIEFVPRKPSVKKHTINKDMQKQK